MHYLIDYENVNTEGLDGIMELQKGDNVSIYYSDKSDRMDMGMVDTLRRVSCDVDMIRTEKTAPNYMDIQIICQASLLLAGDIKRVAIISKDKGYISAKDFFLKRDKEIILAENIKGVPAEEPFTCICAEEPDEISKPEEIFKPEVEKKKVSKLSQTKKLSAADKAQLKEMLSGLPKHNGKLQQSAIDCFNECNTLGQIRYKLVSDVGRADGEKAYKIIEKLFAEFKGLDITDKKKTG